MKDRAEAMTRYQGSEGNTAPNESTVVAIEQAYTLYTKFEHSAGLHWLHTKPGRARKKDYERHEQMFGSTNQQRLGQSTVLIIKL